jgi:hypothetical protein
VKAKLLFDGDWEGGRISDIPGQFKIVKTGEASLIDRGSPAEL